MGGRLVGDVVLARFPFADRSDDKLRPVLVVADVYESSERDWVVCEITSSAMARPNAIALGPGDLASGSLARRSAVRPNRLDTLNEALFGTVVAQLTPTKLSEVLAAVRSLF